MLLHKSFYRQGPGYKYAVSDEQTLCQKNILDEDRELLLVVSANVHHAVDRVSPLVEYGLDELVAGNNLY